MFRDLQQIVVLLIVIGGIVAIVAPEHLLLSIISTLAIIGIVRADMNQHPSAPRTTRNK